MAVTPYFGNDAVTLFPTQDALELLKAFQAQGGGDRPMYERQQAQEMAAADTRAGRVASPEGVVAANSEMAPAAAGIAAGYGLAPAGGTSGMSPAAGGYAAGFRGAPAATPASTPPATAAPVADPVRDAMAEQLAMNKRMMEKKLFDAKYGDEIAIRNAAAYRGDVDLSGTQPLAHYQDRGDALLHAMGQYEASKATSALEQGKLALAREELPSKIEANKAQTEHYRGQDARDRARAELELKQAELIEGGGVPKPGADGRVPTDQAVQYFGGKKGKELLPFVVGPAGLDPATGKPRTSLSTILPPLVANGMIKNPVVRAGLLAYHGDEINKALTEEPSMVWGDTRGPVRDLLYAHDVVPRPQAPAGSRPGGAPAGQPRPAAPLVSPITGIPQAATAIGGRGYDLADYLLQGIGAY